MRSIRRYQFFGPANRYAAQHLMRRLADLVIAGVLLVITLPLMLFVALAIRWEGPGPIFERRTCIGRSGHRFQMLKFRTLVPDPAHTVPTWARKTTQIGEFLRSSRLESLPQLFNVFRGEMSLVDPEGSSPSFLEQRFSNTAPRRSRDGTHDSTALSYLSDRLLEHREAARDAFRRMYGLDQYREGDGDDAA